MNGGNRTGAVWEATAEIGEGDPSRGLGSYTEAVHEALAEETLDRAGQRIARTDAVDAVDRRVWTGDATDWSLLSSLAATHGGDWVADEVLASAISRNVVRAEHEAEWREVPESTLEFLGDIRAAGDGGSTPAWEYSFSYYGWAVRHPTVDASAHIVERADSDPVWAPSAAACAAHLDFEEAINTTEAMARKSDAPATVLSFLVTIREDRFPGEASIAGWDWTPRYGYTFRWLEPRVRSLAALVEEVVGASVDDHTSIDSVRDAIDGPMQDEPL